MASTGSPNPLLRQQSSSYKYKTPAQSRSDLIDQDALSSSPEEQIKHTPMRGEGKRRADIGEGPSSVAVPAPLQMREGGIKRKPIPSVVMEDYPNRESAVSGYSSAAKQPDRSGSPQTSGADNDTPYIRFAIDQLTRDEEVRGSRKYDGLGSGVGNEYSYVQAPRQAKQPDPLRSSPVNADTHYHQFPQPYNAPQLYDDEPQAQADDPLLEKEIFENPPPRTPAKNPKRNNWSRANLNWGMPTEDEKKIDQSPAIFVPASDDDRSRPKLNFRPSILSPLWLGLFVLLLILYIVSLVVCAALSVTSTPGLWDYGSFGDGRYFVFQYLPTFLGMILLLWLFQIEIAVYRIAPFIAMASDNPDARTVGSNLPLCPNGFILPELRHFKARQPIVGIFMIVAWLNIFTIPLLASSFNVYFVGGPDTGRWRWIATQGAIWPAIGLYVMLAVACILLLTWITRQCTGLKWDPRSLADLICLLARSNALDGDDIRDEPAQLGYWRTSQHPEVFHTYGVIDKEERRYGIEDGRIREKQSMGSPPNSPPPLRAPVSRFSDPETDLEAARPLRQSNEQMLRPSTNERRASSTMEEHTNILPWFLRFSAALFWAVLAFVLLLAFLIISYLPSTQVSTGFSPRVSPFVDTTGFSGTNFLYTFLPTLLALFAFLLWQPLDLAYRRLQPFFTLSQSTLKNGDGAPAETTLLLSYPSDPPFYSTLIALSNTHYRLALLTLTTLITATLPILASGIFWAQFSIPRQETFIFSHQPGYHALSVFLTLYALAFVVAIPPSRNREIFLPTPAPNSFAGVRDVLGRARMLDDYAFYSPVSKVDLVTRLLSATPGSGATWVSQGGRGRDTAAAGSRGVRSSGSSGSLADGARGFGDARVRASGGGSFGLARFGIGRFEGRGAGEGGFTGVDRV